VLEAMFKGWVEKIKDKRKKNKVGKRKIKD